MHNGLCDFARKNPGWGTQPKSDPKSCGPSADWKLTSTLSVTSTHHHCLLPLHLAPAATSTSGGEVGRVTGPRRCPQPGTYDCVTTRGERDFPDVIKDLEMGLWAWIIRRTQSDHMCPGKVERKDVIIEPEARVRLSLEKATSQGMRATSTAGKSKKITHCEGSKPSTAQKPSWSSSWPPAYRRSFGEWLKQEDSTLSNGTGTV